MTDQDMDRIAGPHDTTAGKIRALSEAGASTTAISKFLGIRYQHTYNVLLRAGRVGKAEQPSAAAAEAPYSIAHLQPDGGMTLPAELLIRLGAQPGDGLVCRETGEGVLIMSRASALSELQRRAAERMPEHAALLDALLGNLTTRTNEPGS